MDRDQQIGVAPRSAEPEQRGDGPLVPAVKDGGPLRTQIRARDSDGRPEGISGLGCPDGRERGSGPHSKGRLAAGDIPGLFEAVAALNSQEIPEDAARALATIVLTAATPLVLAAAFADTADDFRDIPDLRTAGQVIDMLEAMSAHILEMIK